MVLEVLVMGKDDLWTGWQAQERDVMWVPEVLEQGYEICLLKNNTWHALVELESLTVGHQLIDRSLDLVTMEAEGWGLKKDFWGF